MHAGYPNRSTFRIGAAMLAAATALAACGGGSETKEADPTASTESTASATTTVAEPIATRCDAGMNVMAYYDEAATAGVDVETGFEHQQHEHGGTNDPNSNEMGEVEAVGLLLKALEMDEVGYNAWLADIAAPRAEDAPDDTGRGGHLGPHPWTALTDPADCEQLADEISTTREIALRYPKAADAKAAGWVPVTPYVAGIASHFMRFDYVDGTFNIDEPEMLLYDGTGDEANILGLSYYIVHAGNDEPADGFTGSNDHYHRHVGLCVKGTMVIGDTTTTEEDCKAMGGVKADGSDGWMNHVWSVPGCESPWGLFSGVNPVLDGAMGTHAGAGEPCSASESRARYDMSGGAPS